MTDIEAGTYLNFSRIVEMEGGTNPSEEDVMAAKQYVMRCVQLNGDWVLWNKMTNRYDFLYMTKSRRDEFIRAWELLKKQVHDPKMKKLMHDANLAPDGKRRKTQAYLAAEALAADRTRSNLMMTTGQAWRMVAAMEKNLAYIAAKTRYLSTLKNLIAGVNHSESELPDIACSFLAGCNVASLVKQHGAANTLAALSTVKQLEGGLKKLKTLMDKCSQG